VEFRFTIRVCLLHCLHHSSHLIYSKLRETAANQEDPATGTLPATANGLVSRW
jgi:hypothetical protein